MDVAWAERADAVTKSQRGGSVLIKSPGLSHHLRLRFSFSLSAVREQSFKLGLREILEMLAVSKGLFILINLNTSSAGVRQASHSFNVFPSLGKSWFSA